MEENFKSILFQKSQSGTLQYLVKINFFTLRTVIFFLPWLPQVCHCVNCNLNFKGIFLLLPTSIFPICGAFWMDSFSHGSGHKVFLQRKCVTSAYIHLVEGLGIPIRKHVVGERRCWEVNALKNLWCYFRAHQLSKTFCLSQTDLRKNLPLTFLDQITCISQDWHFPMGSISWMVNWSSD